MGIINYLRDRFSKNDSYAGERARVTVVPRTPSPDHLDNTETPEQPSLLFALARTHTWDAVISHSQSYSVDLSTCDNDNNTILHVILFGRPPVAVVTTMLRASPDLLHNADRNGSLPLHIACSYRCSSEVIELLVRGYPAALSTINSSGFTPLHSLCNAGMSPDALRILLHDPSVCRQRDTIFGRTPMEWIRTHQNLRQQQSLESLHSVRQQQRVLLQGGQERTCQDIEWPEYGALAQELYEQLEEDVVAYREGNFWKCVSLLVVFECYGVLVDSLVSVLHACFELHLMEEWAVLLYEPYLHNHSSLAQNGRTPLHWAASRQDMGMTELILSLNSQLAAIRDAEGKTALQHWYSDCSTPTSHPSALIEAHCQALPGVIDATDVDVFSILTDLSLDCLFVLLRNERLMERTL